MSRSNFCHGTNHYYLVRLYDAQATLTLSLLEQMRINPNFSACTQLEGDSDVNRMSLASPEIKVIVHEKCATRNT